MQTTQHHHHLTQQHQGQVELRHYRKLIFPVFEIISFSLLTDSKTLMY